MSTEINLINKIVVLDEGTIITSDAKSLNFTGSGVTATSSDGDVTINITGGGGGGSVTDVTASTPLFSTGGSAPNITIQQASALQAGYLSSTDWTTFNNKVSSSLLGANNGVATLDGGGKVPVTQLPNSIMDYKGTYNIVTNTPTLVNGTGNAGDVYINTVAGTRDFGAGPITVAIGDWLVYDGSVWQKTVNSNAVASVNGQTGIVTLGVADIPGAIGGSGTTNYLSKFTASGTLGNSALYNTGTNTGIGVTSPISPLHISSVDKVVSNTLYTSDYMTISAEGTAPGFNIISSGDAVGYRGVFKATRSRGTLDIPTALINGDQTFSLIGAGHDGTANLTTAGITFQVDGAVSTNVLPQAITFSTGAGNSRVERMRINSTGQVGVNFVPSAASATFTVKSTAAPSAGESIASFQVSDSSSTFAIQNYANTDGVFIPALVGNQVTGSNQQALNLTGYIAASDDTGSNPIMTFRSATTAFATATTRPLFDFRNWSTSVMTIAASGNIGIGITTPTSRLHVRATAVPSTGEEIARFDVSDDAISYLRIYNASTADSSLVPAIEGKNSFANAALYLIGNGTVDTGTNAVTAFDSRIGSSAVVTRPLFAWRNLGTNLMTMSASGNLGIGTVTPGSKLEVNGNAKILGSLNINNIYTLPIIDGTANQVLQTNGAGIVSWATVSGGGGGTVSSVGLSMPSAFTVTNSPVTGTGVLTVTGAGTTSQYVRGDGTLATFPSVLPTNQISQDVKLGEAIPTGYAVYVFTADGTNIIVKKASNDAEATSSKTLGLLAAGGALNLQTTVVTNGRLAGLNTSTATIGDAVWLGTGGQLLYGLINKPYAPAHLVYIGVVTRVNGSNGEIFVNVQNGFELDELHNVDARNPLNNDGIFYNTTTSLWEHKSIATVLGYTPANKAGETFTGAISATNLSGTNTGDETTATIKTKLGAASSSADGYLTSTDWSTFNGKQNTLSLTTTGSSGSASLIGSTLNIPTYTLAGLGGISLSSLSANTPLAYNSGTGAFSIQVATTAQNGYLSFADWNTFSGKVGGSGTANYVSKFTASGTIGNSLIQDNGTYLGIATAPVTGTKVTVGGGTSHGLRGNTTGSGKYGLYGSNVNDGPGTFVGVYGEGTDNGGSFAGSVYVGGKFYASNGNNTTDVYSLWLQDGTESTGRFLKSITADGRANWATLTVADTGLALTTTGTSGAATLVGNTLNIPQYSGGTSTFDYGLSYAMASQNILL